MSRSSSPPPSVDETSTPADPAALDALREALSAAEDAPDRDDLWNAAEQIAATLQRPDEVAEAHRRVLDRTLTPDVAAVLGRRAVQFYDEWFADGAGLVDVLARVLDVAPTTDWAFHRLSLLLTHAERWPDLLALYDRALAATEEGEPQRTLLDEAAHIAKDFVGDPDRAIDYLRRLVPLTPGDTQRATSLERLLEKQGRYRELIDLWTTRLAMLPAEAIDSARLRIATGWLERLDAPAEALTAVQPLLASPLAGEAAQLLEQILAQTSAPVAVRVQALALLRRHHGAGANRAALVRALAPALGFLDGDERNELHRQMATLLVDEGRETEALEHHAALLLRQPDDEENRTTFRGLTARVGSPRRYAEALAEAAEAASLPEARRTSFLLEAAELFQDPLHEEARAIDLYGRILNQPTAPPDLLVDVARRSVTLLEQAGRWTELLPVLERLAGLEPDPIDQRRVLGQLAVRAAAEGEMDEALAAWSRCLEGNPTDQEALDAVVELLERTQRWEPLVEALRRRSRAATDPKARRQDLVTSARVEEEQRGDIAAAIRTWSEILAAFQEENEDGETLDALARLFVLANRWSEFAELAEGAATRAQAPNRQAHWLAWLGEAYLEHLDQPQRAASFYASALVVDPRHEGARSGMTALLTLEETALAATTALAAAYETTGEWSQTLSLLEPRLRVAANDDERVRLLLEATGLAEAQADDPRTALTHASRAFPLAAARPDVENELVRLGQLVNGWPEVVAAYEAALQTLGNDAPLAPDMRLRLGMIRQTHLNDLTGALADARWVTAHKPGHPGAAAFAIQVAGRLGRWADAADEGVAFVRVRGADSLEVANVFEAWEEIATETQGWDASATALAEEIATATDLTAAMTHALQVRLAIWHRDRRQDPAAAEAALLLAIDQDDTQPATLELLAKLQRRSPNGALITTLLRLADVGDEELAALREAAEVALLPTVADHVAGEAILERLWETSTKAWSQGSEEAAELSRWSLERRVELALADGKTERAILLLVRGSEASLPPADSRELRHRAATVAAGPGHDAAQAIDLYQAILAEDPVDGRALTALSSLYEAEGRLVDLLALQQQELLTLSPDTHRRLTLRLAMAQHFGVLGRPDERVAVLRENLVDVPGHGASIEALTDVLTAAGDEATLVDLLTQQAEQLGPTQQALVLWGQVARVAESSLGDVNRSIAAYERVVAIEPTPEALDALARLHEGQGDYDRAVVRLRQRLEQTARPDRSQTVAELARAYLGAGDPEAARTCLEQALSEDPTAEAVRTLLAKQYRTAAAWEPLAALLQEGAEYASSPDTRLAYWREAADCAMRRLQRPDDAITLLQQAIDLAPEDRSLRTTLAEALRLTGRFDEAGALLEELLAGFGRRRPPERALVHFQLAHVARARGDAVEALAQLEIAAAMDVSHSEILRSLADVARENGQLERAERAYRALLLIVRRQRSAEEDDEEAVTASEVMLELHRLARELGQPERAREILESALETAGQNERETARFEHALRALGENEMLLRALRLRLARAFTVEQVIPLVKELTDLLGELDQPDEALEANLQALAAFPGELTLHEGAQALAARLNQMPRYAERLGSLASGVAHGDPRLAFDLWFRLGSLSETAETAEAGAEPARAAAAYEQAEATGVTPRRAWRALTPLYEARGDRENQCRVLRLLVQTEAEPEEEDERTNALYQLTSLLLAEEETRDEGVAMATWAVDRNGADSRVITLLADAVLKSPSHPSLLALDERVARLSGDPARLLDALERAAAQPNVPWETLREGAETAMALGEEKRADALLRRAAEMASDLKPGHADRSWASVLLAERRQAAGDYADAVQWLQQAVTLVDSTEAYSLERQIADLTLGPLQKPELAEDVYERLRRNDPEDRTLWEPLRQIYAVLGHQEKLITFLEETLDDAPEGPERGAIRLAYARLLLENLHQPKDAIEQLRLALAEDPDDVPSAQALLEILRSSDQTEELTTILEQQLDRARARRDLPTLGDMARQLGLLLAPTRREDALEVYRSALAIAPDHRDLLRALSDLLDPDDDPHERADILERLLTLASGEEAVALAHRLLSLRAELDDEPGGERALVLGFRGCPENPIFRGQLEERYRQRQAWAELAAMLVVEARASTTTATTALSALRQAATLHREQLHDSLTAAELLREARQRAPANIDLLGELVHALTEARAPAEAMTELSSALETSTGSEEEVLTLLRWRATVASVLGDDDQAIADLETAYARGGPAAAPALSSVLERQRQRAAEQGDEDRERGLTQRMADVLEASGEPVEACDVLVRWANRHRDDVAIWHTIARLHVNLEQWATAVDAFRELVRLETGEAQADAAMRLVEAGEQAGRLVDTRTSLEFACECLPEHEGLRQLRRRLYGLLGAYRELAALCLEAAQHTSDEGQRYEQLRQAAELLLTHEQDAAAAISALEQALHVRPGDHEATVLLADAYTVSGQLAAATALLEAAAAAHKGRRSKELAMLHHRMARVAYAAGDRNVEMAWLGAALDVDMQNGHVAAELAEVAMTLGQLDVATKALRAVVLMKTAGPMSRAVAYLQQARILHHQGDARRAILMAKKAQAEDPHLEEARAFLQELGA